MFLFYKGFSGSIEYSVEDTMLFGQILNIKDTITYEGFTRNDLYNNFIKEVDNYLVDFY